MKSTGVSALIVCFLQLSFASEKQKSTEEHGWSYVELNKNVEEHQDAWKFISRNATMYLKYRSYDKEGPSGSDVKCIKSSFVSINEEEGFVVHKMEFWDTHSSQIGKVESRLTTKKSKGYKISNLLVPHYGPQQGQGRGRPEAVFPLAFTDYEGCAIIRVPQKDGCQLWTYEEGLRSLKGYCHFIYNVLCGKRKYDVYSDQLCGYLDKRGEKIKTEL